MTNWELTQILLEEGVMFGTFVIINDEKKFKKECLKHVFGSYPVWDEKSFEKFITNLKDSDGIHFIFNSGLNEFKTIHGYIEMYTNHTLISQRQRKLSKIRSMVFKHQMENNGI